MSGEGAAHRGRAPVRDDTLAAWLREEAGLDEYRRVVRETETTIIISKFPDGFAADLFATLDLLPELFDDGAVAAVYGRLAAEHLARGEAPLRAAVWREAAEGLLRRLGGERGIGAERLRYIVPGLESVQAVIDAVMWSAPTVAEPWTPRASEREACAEALGEMLATSDASRLPIAAEGSLHRDLFTRYYGALEGRSVESYCPGARFARRLVAQAWRVCGGA